MKLRIEALGMTKPRKTATEAIAILIRLEALTTTLDQIFATFVTSSVTQSTEQCLDTERNVHFLTESGLKRLLDNVTSNITVTGHKLARWVTINAMTIFLTLATMTRDTRSFRSQDQLTLMATITDLLTLTSHTTLPIPILTDVSDEKEKKNHRARKLQAEATTVTVTVTATADRLLSKSPRLPPR